MSIFGLFDKKKRQPQVQVKFKIQELLFDPVTGQVGSNEYDNLEQWAAQHIYKPAISIGKTREKPYEVFLCYNSRERLAVLAIAKKLSDRGMALWIDQEGILGGETNDEAIKQAVIESAAAAVFVGPAGLGRYQRYEVRALIDATMSNKIRVIPVLLPGCDALPESEIFLRQHQYVKFSTLDDLDALDKLVKAVRAAM